MPILTVTHCHTQSVHGWKMFLSSFCSTLQLVKFSFNISMVGTMDLSHKDLLDSCRNQESDQYCPKSLGFSSLDTFRKIDIAVVKVVMWESLCGLKCSNKLGVAAFEFIFTLKWFLLVYFSELPGSFRFPKRDTDFAIFVFFFFKLIQR